VRCLEAIGAHREIERGALPEHASGAGIFDQATHPGALGPIEMPLDSHAAEGARFLQAVEVQASTVGRHGQHQAAHATGLHAAVFEFQRQIRLGIVDAPFETERRGDLSIDLDVVDAQSAQKGEIGVGELEHEVHGAVPIESTRYADATGVAVHLETRRLEPASDHFDLGRPAQSPLVFAQGQTQGVERHLDAIRAVFEHALRPEGAVGHGHFDATHEGQGRSTIDLDFQRAQLALLGQQATAGHLGLESLEAIEAFHGQHPLVALAAQVSRGPLVETAAGAQRHRVDGAGQTARAAQTTTRNGQIEIVGPGVERVRPCPHEELPLLRHVDRALGR
jgi:hypothetical protein